MEKYAGLETNTLATTEGVAMRKLTVGVLCAFLCATLYAQPWQTNSEGSGAPIVVASGFFLLGHCTKKCKEMRCSNMDVCERACSDNKGTISKCPRDDEILKR
jgi:hypothetical protein